MTTHYFSNALVAAAFALCLTGCAIAPKTVLNVSPSGNDAWSGAHLAPNAPASDGPFATLARARDEIRARRRAGTLPPGDVEVRLAPGTYALTAPFELAAQDSGLTGRIVYRAAKRGTAVLTGGAALEGWSPVSDPAVLKRLDPAARDHVLTADLPEQRFPMLPGFASGFGVRQSEYPVALYQANDRLPVARWPNQGFVKTGECLGNSNTRSHEGRSFTDGVFKFEDPRLTRWVGEPELWFNGLWFVPWADEKIRLKAIDPAAQTIALANGHVFGFRKAQDFYAFNAISEIDHPGEWAIDRAARRIYLWPAADPQANPVLAARCDTLVQAAGVTNVTFEGLTFEACRQTALTFKACTGATVAASTVRHTGGWAVQINGGSCDTVIGCDLYDLGEGGVHASGGNRDRLIPGGHVIENNHIHNIGRYVACYRPGASVDGVGNAIRHNLIYGTDHQALSFDGNDHVIEYNIVHDICQHTSDAGPLYACARDWSKRGTIIRYNLIHAAGDRIGPGDCNGIYLDDHTSGTLVYGNIVSQCGWGIELGGGKNNIVSNNIIVNCRESIGLHSRGIDSFAKPDALKGRESGCFRLLLQKLALYRSPLWANRYPTMLAPLDMEPIDAMNAHGNIVRDNVLAGTDRVKVSNAKSVMRTCIVTNNPVFNSDPGFVDLCALDFRLRPDAPIFAQLPDFHAPEFEKMGLYDSPLRASPAVKFGPHATRSLPVQSPEIREHNEIATLFLIRPTAGQTSSIRWRADGTPALWTSTAALTLEGDALHIVVGNPVDPDRRLVGKHAWGEADGVEVALAVARGPGRQDADPPFVLRGYADGAFESAVISGVSEANADRLARAVQFAAHAKSRAAWSADWRIPLAALGLTPELPLPILAQITVCRSSDRSLARWAQRPARETWDVYGAYALWPAAKGQPAFLPGAKTSVCRIDVTWGNGKNPMTAGAGAENPTWATPEGSRIVAAFGDVSADRWHAYSFSFTPARDGTVLLELMGFQGFPTVWTAYDDFRIEGAEYVNGDFETVPADNNPAGWILAKSARLIQDPKRAASGARFVEASHDMHVMQWLHVKGGQPVTVHFQARGVLGNGDAP